MEVNELRGGGFSHLQVYASSGGGLSVWGGGVDSMAQRKMINDG